MRKPSADPAVGARLVDSGVKQLKAFSDNGGVVLFGTDVGFIKIYDTSLEYELMHRALSEKEVLATLTTNPASISRPRRRAESKRALTPISWCWTAIPMADVSNLAKVAYTIRAGQVIYRKP